ncbi:MAG TPA: hypothetical protein VFU15_15180 [Bacteroidia bacterium]|nr:hypothetical protein [Bacteroidia bacterium]
MKKQVRKNLLRFSKRGFPVQPLKALYEEEVKTDTVSKNSRENEAAKAAEKDEARKEPP